MKTQFRMLLVEDDAFNRETLSLYLQEQGCDVSECGDGREAFDILQKDDSFDIVLLDINLPSVSGLDVLQEVRKSRSRVQLPVILVTARDLVDDVVRGLELGANDYITKPIEVVTLMARVRAAVALKRSYHDLISAEQQRVMFESLGAACHHLSQPLTVATGWLSQHIEDLSPDREAEREGLNQVMTGLEKAGSIVHSMQDIKEYRTKPYMDEHRILDLGLGKSESSAQ